MMREIFIVETMKLWHETQLYSGTGRVGVEISNDQYFEI